MAEPHFIKCESVPESSPNLVDVVNWQLSLEPHRKDIFFIDKLHGKKTSIKVLNHVASMEWNTEELLPVSVDKIKVEPDLAFTDECTEEHSLGIVKEELDIQSNFEFVSETKPLKEETKSELPEPGPTQENTFEPSADIKGEISIEQHTIDELTPNIKQENNVGDVAALTVHTGEEVHAGTVRSKASPHELDVLKEKSAPSGERLYHCKECNSSFTRKCKLRSHMVLHSGPKSFCCKKCNHSFAMRIELRIHRHSGECTYHCDECKKSFANKDYLRQHMVIHSGIWPFDCKECNSSFAKKRYLRNHMLVHSRKK